MHGNLLYHRIGQEYRHLLYQLASFRPHSIPIDHLQALGLIGSTLFRIEIIQPTNRCFWTWVVFGQSKCSSLRSEEHTSELQSRFDLVCRLQLEQKKNRYCAHQELY